MQRELEARGKSAERRGGFPQLRALRLVPALGSLCVLLVISLFVLRGPDGLFGIQPRPGPQGRVEIRLEDQEILRNLDILKDLDWVQKLVRVIDEGQSDPAIPMAPADTHGMMRHEELGTYA